MPKFKFTPPPKCSVCDKSVYQTEEVRALERIFHKTCLKIVANKVDRVKNFQ